MKTERTTSLRTQVNAIAAELSWACPPECQGQIIAVEYAADGDYIYERATDRSDRSVSVTVYEHPENEREGDFAPWNHAPNLGNKVCSFELAGAR